MIEFRDKNEEEEEKERRKRNLQINPYCVTPLCAKIKERKKNLSTVSSTKANRKKRKGENYKETLMILHPYVQK